MLASCCCASCRCQGQTTTRWHDDHPNWFPPDKKCWNSKYHGMSNVLQVYLDVVEPNPPCSLTDAADWGQMGHWSVQAQWCLCATSPTSQSVDVWCRCEKRWQGNSKWAEAVVPILEARLGWKRIWVKMEPKCCHQDDFTGKYVNFCHIQSYVYSKWFETCSVPEPNGIRTYMKCIEMHTFLVASRWCFSFLKVSSSRLQMLVLFLHGWCIFWFFWMFGHVLNCASR